MKPRSVAVIGGGLAGSECAYALARAGVKVTIFEMKPRRFSPAHVNGNLAELVCSNSFRSNAPDSAVGLLKEEMRRLGSLCMAVAEETRTPAGKALAVDRELFSARVTSIISAQPGITVERREILRLDANGDDKEQPDLGAFDCVVAAAGPLATDSLAASLQRYTGEQHLYFYDAIAPVVDGSSIDLHTAFWGSRYQPDDADYLNCPMTRDEYSVFYEALLEGKTFPVRDFEEEKHFEGCMPVEALAGRGFKTLLFGPLKPVGFDDPRSGRRPFALLQLRPENRNKTMFNLVGCQSKLTYSEQERIFRLIPGLERAEFARYASMHRNTFVNAPKVLAEDLSLRAAPHIYLAGQITGVEGYVESAAVGLWLGLSLGMKAAGQEVLPPPTQTALGSLLGHLRLPAKRFQPSNVQFGLMPEPNLKAGKTKRRTLYADRARLAFAEWFSRQGL
jgi:methylenetetrahydrofolate--tRNA-(uracil-5-)-methyltransferase